MLRTLLLLATAAGAYAGDDDEDSEGDTALFACMLVLGIIGIILFVIFVGWMIKKMADPNKPKVAPAPREPPANAVSSSTADVDDVHQAPEPEVDYEAERLKAEREAKAAAAKAEAARKAKEKADADRLAAIKAAEEKAAYEAAEKARLEELRLAAEQAEEEERAAAEAALEEARLAAEQEAAERARREMEFTLILSSVSAKDLPDADYAKGAAGGSDPYARFTLLEVGFEETGRTEPLYNTQNPTWKHAVQLTLPQGAECTMNKNPLVRIAVFDKDLTDEDDALGTADIRLEGDSGAQTLTLKGIGDFKDFPISFKWHLDPYVPPPATLKITGIKLSEVPSMNKRQATKKNLLDTADHKHQAGDPYLKFSLMEVGDLIEVAKTPCQKPTTHAHVALDWSDLELVLELPKGCPRPPLLEIELWDEKDSGGHTQALASDEIRLTEGNPGTMKEDLTGRKGLTNTNIEFKYEIVELQIASQEA